MYLLAVLLLLVNPTTINAGVTSGRLKRGIDLRARDGLDPNNTTFVCMFMTNEAGWEGEMQNLCEVAGVCAGQLPDGLTANVSSAGPTDGQTCFLYSEAGCTGFRSAPMVYPGYSDLSVIEFDKKAVSWRCWKMCGYVIDASSSTSAFTVSPTIGSPSSPSSKTTSISFTFSPSASSQEAVQARQIETTLSSNTKRSITTTLMGSLPDVQESSTWVNPAPFDSTTVQIAATSPTSVSVEATAFSPGITSVDSTTFNPVPTSVVSTTFNPVPTSVDNTTFPLAGSTTASTSTVNTNTPGFSMSSSSVTMTHTFADGSTTVITTAVIQPVPTVPTQSGSA